MADNRFLIVIPARMAATRLPGKPLAEIAGAPMVVHVLRRAEAAAIGPVVVATDSEVIAACVEKAGGRAVMTRADHICGTDRVREAGFRSGVFLDAPTQTLYSLNINRGTVAAVSLKDGSTARTASCGGRPYDVALARNRRSVQIRMS